LKPGRLPVKRGGRRLTIIVRWLSPAGFLTAKLAKEKKEETKNVSGFARLVLNSGPAKKKRAAAGKKRRNNMRGTGIRGGGIGFFC
jgi:hypothetical protein